MTLRATRLAMLALIVSLLGCDESADAAGARAEAAADDLSGQVGLEIYLSPDPDSFETLFVGIGSISATLDSVAPDPHGALLHLTFGNPLTADLSHLYATVAWGSLDAEKNPIVVPDQQRNGVLIEALPAGHWSHGTFLIPDLPPSRIGFVRISHATIGNIQLK